MLDRTLSALVALSLAFLVWLYARSRDQEVLDNVPLPVHVNLAKSQVEQYRLEVPEPCQVPVSFTGPPARIRELRGLLQRGELRVNVTLTVPEERLHDSRYLEAVRVDAADVHAPPAVTPMLVEGRNRIPVTLHRLVERHLPVHLDSCGDERIASYTVDPPNVLVHGPEEVLDRLRSIPTQPYLLPDRPELPASEQKLTGEGVPLVQEIDGRSIDVAPATVTVHVTLQPRKKLYELDVPVHFLCPPNFGLRPRLDGDNREGRVRVTVEGPTGEELPAVLGFVDLTRQSFEPGLHREPLRLQLPKDFQAVRDTPPRIAFRLDVPEPAAEGVGTVHEP